jgi:hypothetical protein
MMPQRRWPDGSGAWIKIQRPHTIVLASSRDDAVGDDDTLVVNTPLDVIARLEVDELSIETIVLAGLFAVDRVLDNFLRETYPAIRVVAAPYGLAIPQGNQSAISIR